MIAYPAEVDVDDRMACALYEINLALHARCQPELSDFEVRNLRAPRHFLLQLDSTAQLCRCELSSPRALLKAWHAWHNGG